MLLVSCTLWTHTHKLRTVTFATHVPIVNITATVYNAVKNKFLLIDSVGNKEVEGKIIWKHLLKVLGKFPKGSSITAMVLLLQL